MPQYEFNSEDTINKLIYVSTLIVKTREGTSVSNRKNNNTFPSIPKFTRVHESKINENLIYGDNEFTRVNEFSLLLEDFLPLDKINLELFPNFKQISREIQCIIKNAIQKVINTQEGSVLYFSEIIVKSNSNKVIVKDNDIITSQYALTININSLMVIDYNNNISLKSPDRGLSIGNISKNNFPRKIYKDATRSFFKVREDNNKFMLIDDRKIPRNNQVKNVPASEEPHKKSYFRISLSLADNIKKSLIDDSPLKQLSSDNIITSYQKSFFSSLGFYQASMEMDGVKKYYLYKDNEFDFYIDMLISKEFSIRIGKKKNIYDSLYEELYSFLKIKNIRIGEFGKLILEKKNIIIETAENLQFMNKIVPAKSKKLKFT